MPKDYYKILELEDGCNECEIKSAYRRLARKWHPDVAGNTPDNISKFKDINEAYETLSNKSKRSDYDAAKKFYDYASKKRENNFSEKEQTNKTVNEPKKENKTQKANKNFYSEKEINKDKFNFNWEEFIAKKYREAQFRKSKPKNPQRGKDIFTDVEISVFEAASGTTKVLNMLQTEVCSKCGGRKFVNGGKCNHCNGKGEVSNYKRFNVKIPAGIKNNSKIRLAGEGEKGINNGKSGDLYVTVHVKEPENYTTDGLNILKTIEIAPQDAILGCVQRVITINGAVNLKIAPNTQNGQRIKLSGCGIKHKNDIGDMIVTVKIQIPKDLTAEELELYKKLQEISKNKNS